MFNTRIETVDTSDAFREAFKKRRCLIPAVGTPRLDHPPVDGNKDPWLRHLPERCGVLTQNDPLFLSARELGAVDKGDDQSVLASQFVVRLMTIEPFAQVALSFSDVLNGGSFAD